MKFDINKPHDALFKTLFSEKENITDFIKHYLPYDIVKNIDIQSVKLIKETFVSKHLKDYYSDLLFEVKYKTEPAKIYILFEHKSSPDLKTPLQILSYMVRIWEKEIKQWKKDRLTPVIPVIYYHGRAKWSLGVKFSGLFKDIDNVLVNYLPEFEYLLHNLSEYQDDELKGNLTLILGQMLMKHIFDRDIGKILDRIIQLFIELTDKRGGIEYLRTFLMYILSVTDIRPEEIKEKMVEYKFEKGGKLIMTTAELLIKEGMEKGIKKGKLEGKLEAAKKMLEKGIDIDTIVEITGLSKDDILKG